MIHHLDFAFQKYPKSTQKYPISPIKIFQNQKLKIGFHSLEIL